MPTVDVQFQICAALIILVIAWNCFATGADLQQSRHIPLPNALQFALVGAFVARALIEPMSLSSVVAHVGFATLVLVVGFILFARGWLDGGVAKILAAMTLYFGADIGTGYLIALVFLMVAAVPAFKVGRLINKNRSP